MVKHRCDCGVVRDQACPKCERCACKDTSEWCAVCRHVKIPHHLLDALPEQHPAPVATVVVPAVTQDLTKVPTTTAQTTCRCKAGEWCLLCAPGGALAPKPTEPQPSPTLAAAPVNLRELRTAYLALVAAHNQVGVQLEVLGEALDRLAESKEG